MAGKWPELQIPRKQKTRGQQTNPLVPNRFPIYHVLTRRVDPLIVFPSPSVYPYDRTPPPLQGVATSVTVDVVVQSAC